MSKRIDYRDFLRKPSQRQASQQQSQPPSPSSSGKSAQAFKDEYTQQVKEEYVPKEGLDSGERVAQRDLRDDPIQPATSPSDRKGNVQGGPRRGLFGNSGPKSKDTAFHRAAKAYAEKMKSSPEYQAQKAQAEQDYKAAEAAGDWRGMAKASRLGGRPGGGGGLKQDRKFIEAKGGNPFLYDEKGNHIHGHGGHTYG